MGAAEEGRRSADAAPPPGKLLLWVEGEKTEAEAAAIGGGDDGEDVTRKEGAGGGDESPVATTPQPMPEEGTFVGKGLVGRPLSTSFLIELGAKCVVVAEAEGPRYALLVFVMLLLLSLATNPLAAVAKSPWLLSMEVVVASWSW